MSSENATTHACHPVSTEALRLIFQEAIPTKTLFARTTHSNIEQSTLIKNSLSLAMITSSEEKRHHNRRHLLSENGTTRDTSHPLPWHCTMKSKWKSMKSNIYPQYIETGRCQKKRCMAGMYECVPKKYVIKVLKRSGYECNPVPRNDASHPHYEEAWQWKKIKVTVACQCGRREAKKGELHHQIKQMLGL